jgi:hypothetical protein
MNRVVSHALLFQFRQISDQPDLTEDHCDFCGRRLLPDHRHFLERPSKKILCACDHCTSAHHAGGPYDLIPRRYEWLEDLVMPESLWLEFMIPVNIAFFVHDRETDTIITFYPGPVGATFSQLQIGAWQKLVQNNPDRLYLLPDLEAFIVNRLDATAEYFIAPIDWCYRLVGVMRLHRKGIFGGREAQDAVRNIIQELKSTAYYAGPVY